MAETISPDFNLTREQIASFVKDPRTVRDIEAFLRMVREEVPSIVAAKVDETRQIIAGTGLTGTHDLSADVTLALADTAVTPATYGDATHVGQFTVDQQGRLTFAQNVAITPGYTDEQARDAIGTALVAGSNVTITVNDAGDTITIAASGGGGAAWALAGAGQTATGVWDFAVDGAKSNINFTGLAGFSDLLMIARGVTQSVSGLPFGQVSVNNGSSYFTTSGDYVQPSTAGVESNAGSTGGLIDTGATAARSWGMKVLAANAAVPRLIESTVRPPPGANVSFIASASAINAWRLGTTGGGTFNGGKVYCLAR